MGRIEGILSMLALSAVSQLALAGEPSSVEAESTPVETEQSTAAEASVEDAPAPPPPRAAAPERREPRVIWAAPGQAPERPRPSPPVAPPAPPRSEGFGLDDVRWVVGLDRAATIAGYRSTARLDYGSETVTSGLEASLLGHVNQEAATPLVLPRLSLDARWAGGWSLGIVLSYAARSAERSASRGDVRLPSSEAALFGPRIGWLKPLSNHVGIWLRGGPTWARRASSVASSQPSGLTKTVEERWAVSLEPQVVVMPWRHVGLSLGAAFDIGFEGDNTVTQSGVPGRERTKESTSTYGMTASLLAVF